MLFEKRIYVSAYGEISNLTPSIDKIAKEGAVFTKTYAASGFTLAGLTALLTGRFASTTGVTGWDKGLTQDIPTLPEILGFYGYKTADLQPTRRVDFDLTMVWIVDFNICTSMILHQNP